MRAGGGDLQAGALGSGNQFSAGAMHFDAQLRDVFADLGAGLDDGLMHLLFDLLNNVRRSRRDELHYVRAELTGGGVNNLKFFFYADGEAVSHGVALRVLGLWGLLSAYHTPSVVKIALLRCISSGYVQVGRSGPRPRLDHPCPVSGDTFRSTPKARRNGKKGTEPVDLAALRSTYK